MSCPCPPLVVDDELLATGVSSSDIPGRLETFTLVVLRCVMRVVVRIISFRSSSHHHRQAGSRAPAVCFDAPFSFAPRVARHTFTSPLRTTRSLRTGAHRASPISMHMPFLTQQLDEATRTRRTQTRPNLPTSTGRPPRHRLLPLSSAGSQSSDYMMTSSRKLLMVLLCFMLQLASLVAFAGPAAPATAVPRSRRGGFVQVASSGMCAWMGGMWDSARVDFIVRKVTYTDACRFFKFRDRAM